MKNNVLLSRKVFTIWISVAVIIFVALITSGVLAIHPQDPEPTRFEYDGAVVVSAIDLEKYQYKVGERIEFKPKLINMGNKPITIVHADPPFIVNVYSPLGVPAWSYPYPILLSGAIVKLEPNIPYSWDEERIQQRYDIRLYMPGEYKLVSYWHFVVEESAGENLQTGDVYSEPVIIKIVL